MTQSQYTDRLEAMHNLRETMMDIQRDQTPNIEAVGRVKDIVTDAGKILNNNKGQIEMLLDGQIFATGQDVFRGAVHNLDTNLEPFSLEDYSNGIMAYLDSTTGRQLEWKLLSTETYSLVKMSSPLDFQLGNLTLDPPPKPEKVVKERQARSAKTEKGVVEAAAPTEAAADKTGKQNNEHILKCLARCYRKNKEQPINFFKFIVDPTDFWRTVHNVYQCSHLVKDNMVKMSIEDGQPMLEPRKKKGGEQQSVRRNQFNMRLTPYEYRQLIETFQVTEALITPI